MLNAIDNWFLQQEEPSKSCLLFLRDHILKLDKNMSEAWNYGMPLYRYKDHRLCYLWFHKTYKQPYICFVDGNLLEHPDLLVEKRARMKIFLIDPDKDIPVKKVEALLKTALSLYA